MFIKQYYASIVISVLLLILILRLVQKGRLDIAYCWLWLGIGLGMVFIVNRYDWLVVLSDLIGANTPTTTLFLMGFLVLLLMCLQFSLVLSSQRRQLKKLAQHLALLRKKEADENSGTSKGLE